jgi:heterodisulfide reductase subunit A
MPGELPMTDEKKPVTAQNKKVGVYICHCGGNISDHVDVEAVRHRAQQLDGVSVARTNMFMCSDPGQEMIMADLESGTVERVVVASCAPALHETTFRSAISRAGANPYIYEHANIREQVSWVHHGSPATEKAFHLVAAATAKAAQLKPLAPIRVTAREHVTVIGGGVAGLRAAKDLADRGIPVDLVERSPFLGGQAARLDRIAPFDEKASALVAELAAALLEHPAVKIHTCAQVEEFEGAIGNFTLKVRQAPPEDAKTRQILAQVKDAEGLSGSFIPFAGVLPQSPPARPSLFTVQTGAIILATGFKSYTPQAGEYGFGKSAHVITLPQLIRQMTQGPEQGSQLEIGGRAIRSMVMIHCVGSRQIPGIHPEDPSGNLNEYCSRTCCTATLNAAATIRRKFPGTQVYDMYRDIRTYGRGQEAIYEAASRNGVVFLRFTAEAMPEVTLMPSGHQFPFQVTVIDTLTFGEELQVAADLVVLATGMEPGNVTDLIEMMKLPVGADRFLLEVHPKLRPVELPVGGILLAGTCQAPMDVGESCSAAGAAAAKASALLTRGYVELDPFVAEVDLSRCRGSGACVTACLNPGALALVEMEIDGQRVRRAQVTPALCLGCGACVAVCPENAIDVNGMTLKQYEAMVEMIVADPTAV